MVAECLGALTSMHAEALSPTLQMLATTAVSDGRPLTLWTLVTSLRFTFSRFHAPGTVAASVLPALLDQFLPLLSASDLEVKAYTHLTCADLS